MMPESSEIEYYDLNYSDKHGLNADWVFFSPATAQASMAYQLADMYRKTGAKVAMGGPHVSVLPEEALKHSDAVFIGEAEITIRWFLEDVINNTVKRIYSAHNFPDLAKTPFPLYHLAKKYQYKSVPVQTSRGCPRQCCFCISSKIYGSGVRCKAISQLSYELNKIKEIYGKPYLFFTDDNLFINKNRNKDFLETVKETGASWYAFSDASVADDLNLLFEIAGAGCTQLLIGFESLCAENLRGLNANNWKMKRLDFYKEAISRIQSFGIGVVGSFILGMDNDNASVFENLYKFVEETLLYATNITVLTPFPGTELYKQYESEGRLISKDWSMYNGFDLTFQPKNMTCNEFYNGYAELNTRLNSTDRMNKLINHFKSLIEVKYKRLNML